MNRLEWALNIYYLCEYKSCEIDYESCTHSKSKGGCVFDNCPKYYLLQINELENEAENKGFKLRFLDRGINTKLTMSSGRYELWLESHCQDSKIYFCQSLEDLCNFGIPLVKKAMETRTPGLYSDPI